MKEYFDLLKKYEEQYPEDESPMMYAAQFGHEIIKKMLKERNGRRIVFNDTNPNADDGGDLVYL